MIRNVPVAFASTAMCAALWGCVPISAASLVPATQTELRTADANTLSAKPHADEPHFWVEDPAFDASRDALPVGVRDELSTYRWRWGGTDDLEWLASQDGQTIAAMLHRTRAGTQSRTVDYQAIIQDRTLPDRTRAAAAEAWSVRLARSGDGEMSWTRFGRLLESEPAGLVRAELLRSIGRGIHPQRIPAVVDTVRRGVDAPFADRAAVLDCCLLAAVRGAGPAAMPEGLEVYRFDPDARIRRRYGRLAAAAELDGAVDVLKSQMRDVSADVRDAAWVSLGLVDGEVCVELLKGAAEANGERTRAAAVLGLAAAGVVDIGADDPAAVVRQAAATALATVATPASQAKLQTLVVDSDRQVQLAAVSAATHWSDEYALPVFLRSLEGSTHSVRVIALDEVRRRTGSDRPFVVEASEAERQSRVEVWRRELGITPSGADQSGTEVLAADSPRDLPWAVHAAAAGSRSPEVWQVLRALTPRDVPTLESLIRDLPDAGVSLEATPLWSEVLPTLREDFAAAARIASPRLEERCEGAERLAEYCARRSPSRLIVARLPRLLAAEQNGRVWRAIVRAAGADAETARAVLPLALHCEWPDVRLMACEAIQSGASADLSGYLRPLFEDGSAAVRAAAATAAGRCGNPALLDGGEQLPGLRDLRLDPSSEVRTAAVAAMAGLGDAAAVSELLRQAHSVDARTRRSAAAALAEAATSDPAFGKRLPAVLTLAWTERDFETRKAYLRILDTVGGRPTDGTDDERLQYWSGVIESP